jgi:hypothetical protein
MMSHHEVGPERDAPDAEGIARVVAELRAPVPVRAEWRAGLLRGVAMLPPPGGVPDVGHVKRWRLRPITAIAAGIVCAFAGAAVATLFLRAPQRGTPGDALTNLTATMPLPGEIGGRSTVRFVFVAPYASRVALVGDFNGWNPATMPMRRSTDGRAWLLDVPLAPGRHVYSFIVDGDLAPDPTAPRAGDDDFGVPSSVVLVTGAKT